MYNKINMKLCKLCMICGEPVELTSDEKLSLEYGHNIDSKMCDKCREAILYARKLKEDNIVLMEYDFKVGDVVITDRGATGIIEDICNCDQCKARGFYELKVKVTNSDDMIYITDTDKRNGFIRFYQIGKYKFGNLDKESVENSIEYEKGNIKEAHKRLREYKRQLSRLNQLESWRKEDKDFVVRVDYDGNL